MHAADFTQSSHVHHQIRELEAYWADRRPVVSDVIDDEGHQYVDLVLEGGGVLGIALVGYTYALERVGIRFLSYGGTSAGAINATFLAALGRPDEAKSESLVETIANSDMMQFVDGDGDARDFVEAMVRQAGLVKLGWKGMQVLDNLLEDYGLNPGDRFEAWCAEILDAVGVSDAARLRAKMEPAAPLRRRDGTPLTVSPRLAIVAADVTTETKVVFPDMAGLYWRDASAVHPARFVRASMSIPGFFHPMRVTDLPQGPDALDRWNDQAGYQGSVPDEVFFVDGGIMSNFPIGLFHVRDVPTRPTFGAKLGVERSEPAAIDSFFSLLGAVFDAARHTADYDFLLRNPDYRTLVGFIHTGSHNWLDFYLDDDAKIDLFARGVRAAATFLTSFDWASYKASRAGASGPAPA